MISNNPMVAAQRNAITQALMNVQNPPPRTQMPGGGMGAPTQSPIVPQGVTAAPTSPTANPAMQPGQATAAPGGVQGPQQPFAPGMPGVGAPQMGPPQVPPPQMGGAPLPQMPNTQNLVGMQPPQMGLTPGTQMPVPGQAGRY